MKKADRDKWKKVCAAAESHEYQGFRVSTEFFRELLDENDRFRRALEEVLAEADNNKCNEMDSLITCVNTAAHALDKE